MLAALVSLLLFQGGPEEAGRLEQEAAETVRQQPGEAVDKLRRAVAILEDQEEPDRPALARTLNTLAYALSLNGQGAEALTTGTRALDLARAEGAPSPTTAAVQRNLAGIAERAGRLELARSHADGAVRDHEATYGINPTAAEFREYAGQLALRTGDADAAVRHLVMAMAIYERVFPGPGRARMAGPMHGLATVFAGEGWFDAALDLHDRALRLLEATGQDGSPLWSRHLAHRRTMLVELGETRLARRDMERWVQAVARHVPAERKADACLNWAATWLSLGAPRRARARLDRLPGELTATQAARRLLLEGQCLALEGRWRDALEKAGAARAAFAASAPEGSEPVVAELGWLRARALRHLGRMEEAFESLSRLFRSERDAWSGDAARLTPTYLELLATELPAHGVTPELIDLLSFLEAAAARARPRDLAALHHDAWTKWRRSAWAPVARAWLHLADSEEERLPGAFAALDRCRERALLSANAWWLETGAAQRHDAVKAVLELLDPATGDAPDPARRQRRRRELERRVGALRSAGNPWTPYLDPEGVGLERAREALGEGQALLAYHWVDPEVWALLIAPDAAGDRVVRLAETAGLHPLLDRALARLRDPETRCDLQPLAGQLLHPLWERLREISEVTIVADGPLAFLPFEALPAPDGGPWAASCRVSYAPTVRSWLAGPPVGREGRTGSIHLTRAAADDGGAPRGNQLQRLRSRMPSRPDAGPARGPRGAVPEEDPVVSTEVGLVEADGAGKIRARRLLEVWAPAWIDAGVPSATAVVTSPGRQGEELSTWELEDGVVGLIGWRDLSPATEAVVLWRAQVIPRGGEVRHEGLHELVASLWAGGVRDVLVAGWEPVSGSASRFEAMLREAVRNGDPARALAETQRRWLRENRDRPERLDPGIWARMRAFVPDRP